MRFSLLLILLVSLSYLGIGVQPPRLDWGSMLAEAQPCATLTPQGQIAPGVAIFKRQCKWHTHRQPHLQVRRWGRRARDGGGDKWIATRAHLAILNVTIGGRQLLPSLSCWSSPA
nr:hypothetical protein [Corynebacterium pacaense]